MNQIHWHQCKCTETWRCGRNVRHSCPRCGSKPEITSYAEFDSTAVARICLSQQQSKPLPVLELIDWAERYPNESAFQIAVRQSTFCTCGKAKEIGTLHCVPISLEVNQ